ncbi:hypothetical protein [Alteriqipengyuania lutimaris]|nr:hypothetical protein [Alteriqipengyuania lutimaris]MBB3033924.1 hypothetical protein [Alteriqipengyuania lutimaris]
MALSLELVALALAGYVVGLGLGAGTAKLWTLRGQAFRVNARDR